MTVGGLNFSCPRCNNPLFFTFKLADEGDSTNREVHCPGCRTDSTNREVHCPGCRTVWVVALDIHPK